MTYNKLIALITFMSMVIPVVAHDVLLEVKGAAFLPTSEIFRDMYHYCGNFGGEATVGSGFDHVYGFGSIDFLVKHGNTVELNNPTKMTIVNFALGLKYFVPFEHGDFYLGVGVQPTHLTTFDRISAELLVLQSQWSCGGIAKMGVIFDLPHSLFVDLYFDYSFVKFDNFGVDAGQTPVNAGLLGVGIGYRFN